MPHSQRRGRYRRLSAAYETQSKVLNSGEDFLMESLWGSYPVENRDGKVPGERKSMKTRIFNATGLHFESF